MVHRNGTQPPIYYALPQEKFDLKGYLRRYLNYWYLFVLFIPLCLAAAYYHLLSTQPV